MDLEPFGSVSNIYLIVVFLKVLSSGGIYPPCNVYSLYLFVSLCRFGVRTMSLKSNVCT